MANVRVMISSTCFDLAPVREILSNTVQQVGFEPVRSELGSFPTVPGFSTFENCRRAARDGADLLLLIVGGRYGSIPQDQLSSITNLEYREARASGVSVFVFVQQRILDAMPLWRANPKGDFGSHVDSCKVFEFVEELQRDNQWITGFSSVDDIASTFRSKASQLFKYLLDLRRGLIELPCSEFAQESPKVRDLLISQPGLWELKLLAELVCDRITPTAREFDMLRRGNRVLRLQRLGVPEYYKYMDVWFGRLTQLASVPTSLINEDIPKALGPDGTAADLLGLLAVADTFRHVVTSCYEFEIEHRSIVPPEALQKVHELSSVWSGEIFDTVKEFFDSFRKQIHTPGLKGTVRFELKFAAPSGIKDWEREYESAARAHGLRN